MSLKINFNELHSYDELISFFAEIFQPFLIICSSQENSRLLPFFVAYEILYLWFEHMLASDVITHVVHQTQSDMSYIRHIIRMSSSDRSYLISGCLCDIPSRRFLRFIGISKKIVAIEWCFISKELIKYWLVVSLMFSTQTDAICWNYCRKYIHLWMMAVVFAYSKIHLLLKVPL